MREREKLWYPSFGIKKKKKKKNYWLRSSFRVKERKNIYLMKKVTSPATDWALIKALCFTSLSLLICSMSSWWDSCCPYPILQMNKPKLRRRPCRPNVTQRGSSREPRYQAGSLPFPSGGRHLWELPRGLKRKANPTLGQLLRTFHYIFPHVFA